MFARLLVAALALAGMLMWPPAASAHGTSATDDVRLAQTIAGAELTVVIRRTETVPGPLRIDLIAHHPVRALPVSVRVGSAESGPVRTVQLEPGRAGGYPVVFDVAEAGPHELELRAGGELSVLPFRVLVPRAASWERLVYGGFALAALLLGGALVAAVLSWRVPAVLLGGGTVLALVVTLTVALLSPRLPAPVPDGAPSPSGGRPYVQARVATTPAVPVAGEPFTLRLDLVDGSTGRPVDDLAVHHAALAHLIVSSEDGSFFRHVHPLRTGPGRLAATLTADRPGHYLVSTEIERAGSGGQLLSGEVTVGGVAAVQQAPAPARDEVTLSPRRPVAGRPVTVEVDTGRPDLQPWLEMAGHLIIRSQDGGFLGHAHELNSMTSGTATGQAPDETVAAYGPVLRFTVSFPAPGRYLAWVQYAREFRIVTVPFTVTVEADAR